MEPTEKQRLYQSYIAAAEKANKPLAVYAREQSINVHCLYGEKHRLHKKEQKSLPDFVRVQDVSGHAMAPTLLQIRLPNGISLGMPTHQISLDQILQTLAKL